MRAAIIISCIVLFFAALGMIPIKLTTAVSVSGEKSRFALLLRVLHIKVFSMKLGGDKGGARAAEPAKKTEAKSGKEKKKKKKSFGLPDEKKSAGDIVDMIKMLADIAKKTVLKTWRYIRIGVDMYDVSIGTDDAAKTALIYGGAAQATSYLFTFLDETAHFCVKRKAPVNVRADFLSAKTEAKIQMNFTIRVWQIISIAFTAGTAYLRGMKKDKKENKNKNIKEKKRKAD